MDETIENFRSTTCTLGADLNSEKGTKRYGSSTIICSEFSLDSGFLNYMYVRCFSTMLYAQRAGKVSDVVTLGCDVFLGAYNLVTNLE